MAYALADCLLVEPNQTFHDLLTIPALYSHQLIRQCAPQWFLEGLIDHLTYLQVLSTHAPACEFARQAYLRALATGAVFLSLHELNAYAHVYKKRLTLLNPQRETIYDLGDASRVPHFLIATPGHIEATHRPNDSLIKRIKN